MICKSLANDFHYTKLKYKQYLYFSLNIPPLFLLCFFLLSPCFFVYLKFYLMYYQDNITEHHKVIYRPYSRNSQFLQKKTGNKETVTHYWLFKFLAEVKFLVGRQISSRSLVNVNCKFYWRFKTTGHTQLLKT